MPSDVLAGLARRTLAGAAVLDWLDASALASRLYRANTLPASPERRRRLPSLAAVAAWLGLADGGPTARALDVQWQLVDAWAGSRWFGWRRRDAEHIVPGPIAKLYISTPLEALPDVLRTTVATVGEGSAPFALKIGRDLASLLRPDKLVLYFTAWPALEETAARLRAALAGSPAQGVPFAAQLDDHGLLAWAWDPPEGRRPDGASSWRLWLTRRLAEALVAARPATGSAAVAAALAAVAAQGVNTEQWTVPSRFWERFDER